MDSKEKLKVGKNKPHSMYNSDCSSSSSISSNEVFADSPDSDGNFTSLKSLDKKIDIDLDHGSTHMYGTSLSLNKWSSEDLSSSTPKSIPPVPKARKKIPTDVKKMSNGNNDLTDSSSSSPIKNIPSTPENLSSRIYADDSKFYTPHENISIQDGNFNNMKKAPTKPIRRHQRRMSIDGDDLIEVGKLQMALNHLGIDPKPDQWSSLMSKVTANAHGFVKFGDFTAAAKEVFSKEMNSLHISQNSSVIDNSKADQTFLNDAYNRLQDENDQLKNQINKLKKDLLEKESDLKHLHSKCQSYVDENSRLKEELEKEKSSTCVTFEHDFGNIVQEFLSALPDEADMSESEKIASRLQRRVTVLTCQLRKSQLVHNTMDVALNHLLQFADNVRMGSDSSQTSEKSTVSTEPMTIHSKSKRVSRAASLHSMPPPPYPGHRTATDDIDGRTASLQTLALSATSTTNSSLSLDLVLQAKQVISSVRSLLQDMPLPDGWEEGYTPDGNKFYIHHLTQTTSWIHPRSKMVDRSKPQSRRSSIKSEISWV